MSFDWNAENAAHLLERSGFGPSRKDVERAVKRGFAKTLKKVMKPSPKTKKLPKTIDNTSEMQTWWINAMVRTKRPLTDKITLFWHNHFATAISKVGKRERMHAHVATLRYHALGNFRELLGAVARDPAMLIWLDNKDNFANAINENWARELMELFTTGVFDQNGQPNYSEDDVIEVARAFTGWTLKDDEFFFNASKHDDGDKTFKGVTANLGGDDVLDLLVADAATQRRIPAKLWAYFAHPIELDDPIVTDLAAVFANTGGNIAELVEAIFSHDAFYSAEAKSGHVRAPAEFVIGLLRRLGAKIKKGYPRDVGELVRDLGQSLYNPPSVFGWDEDLAWVGTSGMLERARATDWIIEQRDKKKDDLTFRPEKLLGKKKAWSTLDAAGVVDVVLAELGMSGVAAATRSALETYVAADSSGLPNEVVVDDDFIDEKVRGLIALACASPEYQLG